MSSLRIPALLALLAGMLTIAACGEKEEPESVDAGPCSEVQEVEVPKAGDYHKNGHFTAADYATNPPAGGFHSLDLLGPPTIKPPLKDLGAAVHELNHGSVILWPSQDLTSKDEDALLETYRSLAADDPLNPKDKYAQLAIVGNPDQEAPFAMTAWGYLQECESVDPEAIEAFVEEYYASGPEGQEVACTGIGGISKPPDVPACQKQ